MLKVIFFTILLVIGVMVHGRDEVPPPPPETPCPSKDCPMGNLCFPEKGECLMIPTVK
ncbi:hypothetical protein Pmar_PMAR022713, partial [Perkinsus marinus ATCC 50983]